MVAPAWSVTGQLTTTRIPEGGNRFVTGVEVSFITRGGHAGTVFIPDTQYRPEVVRAAIDEKAALMDEIGALQGNP